MNISIVSKLHFHAMFFPASVKTQRITYLYDAALKIALVNIYVGSLIQALLFIYDAKSRRYTYWMICEQVDSFWHRALFGIIEYLVMMSTWISLIPLITILYYWHETCFDLKTLRYKIL